MLQGLYAEKSLASITLTPDIFHSFIHFSRFNIAESTFKQRAVVIHEFVLGEVERLWVTIHVKPFVDYFESHLHV